MVRRPGPGADARLAGAGAIRLQGATGGAGRVAGGLSGHMRGDEATCGHRSVCQALHARSREGGSSTRLRTRRFAEAPGQLTKTDTTSMQWPPPPTAPPSWICIPCRLAARSWISLPTYLSCASGNARPRCGSGSQPWGCGIRCHGRRGSAALAWGALPGRPARWRPVKLATAAPVDRALMSRERREARDRDPMDYRSTEGRGLPSIDEVSSS